VELANTIGLPPLSNALIPGNRSSFFAGVVLLVVLFIFYLFRFMRGLLSRSRRDWGFLVSCIKKYHMQR
jgi:hypothetical protein